MQCRVLFLEDRYTDRTWRFLQWLPKRVQHVVTVTTANEAIDQLARGDYTHVFLDHDLDWSGTWPAAPSGQTVVGFIIEHGIPLQKIIVHSTSGAGLGMTNDLLAAGYQARWLPFEEQLMKLDSRKLLESKP